MCACVMEHFHNVVDIFLKDNNFPLPLINSFRFLIYRKMDKQTIACVKLLFRHFRCGRKKVIEIERNQRWDSKDVGKEICDFIYVIKRKSKYRNVGLLARYFGTKGCLVPKLDAA